MHMLLELLEGGDLDSNLYFVDDRKKAHPRRMGLQRIQQIGGQLLSALRYLHSQSPPIIHQDIKPKNIVFKRGRIG